MEKEKFLIIVKSKDQEFSFLKTKHGKVISFSDMQSVERFIKMVREEHREFDELELKPIGTETIKAMPTF